MKGILSLECGRYACSLRVIVISSNLLDGVVSMSYFALIQATNPNPNEAINSAAPFMQSNKRRGSNGF